MYFAWKFQICIYNFSFRYCQTISLPTNGYRLPIFTKGNLLSRKSSTQGNYQTSHKKGNIYYIHNLADSGFFKNFLYQDGVKSKVSWVFEDLKFKISEGYDQNWCFPDSAQLAVSVLKVLKYPRNCRLPATLIQKVFKKS